MKFVIQMISILYWLIFLQGCDARFVPYLVVGICGIISCYRNTMEHKVYKKDREFFIISIASLVLSLMTVAANFYYFKLTIRDKGFISYLCDLFSAFMIFLGGVVAFWNILTYLAGVTREFHWTKEKYKWHPAIIFVFSTLVISMINIFILFTSYYPGNLSGDSYASVYQALYGDYSNHHPFYYTMVVKAFIQLGLKYFNDINAGVALYSVFQVFFMAACISYVIVTLYQMGIRKKIIIVCWIWYVAMPFHIMYSFTMWKDVMFGGFVIVFIVSIFRICKGVGSFDVGNKSLLLVGSIGMCLFRSNGWFAFFLMFLCFVFLFGEDKKSKKMRYMFLAVLMFTFILKHPVLQLLNVKQPAVIESLSVPAQQIARVITNCDDVKEEHIELLKKVVDVDQIPAAYNIFISDPIKDLVWRAGNQEYLVEHWADYFIMYIEMGLSHPDIYVEAWIDLTKGYWNGGYQYWVWLHKLFENDYGIERTVYLENLHDGIEEYLWNYAESPVLQIFLSIGFHVWIILGISIICIIHKNKEGLFLNIPIMCIVVTLLMATPVYAEFRYAYAVFCSIPFLIIAPFYQDNRIESEREE